MASDSDDLPTPEQVAAYLAANGWGGPTSVAADAGAWLVWGGGARQVWLPANQLADYPRRMREALETVAAFEGRPTPAEQVRRDILEQHRLDCDCGSPAGWHVSHGEAVRDECPGISGVTDSATTADRGRQGVSDGR